MYDFSMNNITAKIYQMFIMGLKGEDLLQEENLKIALNAGLGGVILFTYNIKTKTQTQRLITEIKSHASIEPFISIDEEGGRVERTENLFNGKKFLSAKFASEKGNECIKEQTKEISHLLKELGFNLNFAPCLDVNTNPSNPIIGERAFSDKTDRVIECGNIVTKTYLEQGIIPCTKHFPGHGDASVDSHKELPVINLEKEDLIQNHIRAFKEVKSPMIMIAHLHCPAFDKEKIPSSLSKNIIGYLRKELKYDGLIISDDMVMGGVIKEEAVLACAKAIKAGVNILLYRNSDNNTMKLIKDLAEQSKRDEELRNNIESSYEKILWAKKKYLKITQ